jgi:hypothetical protein
MSIYRDYSDAPFLIRPPVLEDELLSSWLVRTAVAHQIHPIRFMSRHLPQLKPNFWSRDVDVFYAFREDVLEILARKSGKSIDEILDMTLKSYEGVFFDRLKFNTHNAALTSMKIRGRRCQNPGLRFCAKCLEEDEQLYFRKIWRVASYTMCEKHRCELLDRCPNCEIPVSLWKLNAKCELGKCHACEHFIFALNQATREF